MSGGNWDAPQQPRKVKRTEHCRLETGDWRVQQNILSTLIKIIEPKLTLTIRIDKRSRMSATISFTL